MILRRCHHARYLVKVTSYQVYRWLCCLLPMPLLVPLFFYPRAKFVSIVFIDLHVFLLEVPTVPAKVTSLTTVKALNLLGRLHTSLAGSILGRIADIHDHRSSVPVDRTSSLFHHLVALVA